MDVQTTPAALPEWHAFLGAFQVRCRRPEGRQALECGTTRRLTELPHKNGDTIAQTVPGTRTQRWQESLTNMLWDEFEHAIHYLACEDITSHGGFYMGQARM